MLYSEELAQISYQHFGITRLGDATSLDEIGIPVWFACRPNSRNLSVSQGKGASGEQARISALMESIESAVAERVKDHVTDFGSIDDLIQNGNEIVDLSRLARCKPELIDKSRERAWVTGINATTGTNVYAPFELIGLDFRIDSPWDSDAFMAASIGTGAGPSFDFAARHAILELIEMDASTAFTKLGVNEETVRPLIVEKGLSNDLDTTIEKCTRIGIEPTFILTQSATLIPTVGAFIPRRISTVSGPATRMSGGFASRPRAADAALAALLEAIQSRLTEILGSRDDLQKRDYLPSAEIVPTGHPIRLSDLDKASDSGATWSELSTMVSQATSAPVYLFDLDTKVENLTVVRALAPGLNIDHISG